MLFFIYVFVAKEDNFSRGNNKFLNMGNWKDLVSNLVKLYILQVIAFLMKFHLLSRVLVLQPSECISMLVGESCEVLKCVDHLDLWESFSKY